MTLLLDSHTLLWWLAEDPRLSRAARDAIRDPDHVVHVSAASIWEIGIKAAAGRLTVTAEEVRAAAVRDGFRELAVSGAHALAAGAASPPPS